jgi:hypothetical protein
MRQYEPIWIKLKQSIKKPEAERAKGVTIVVDTHFHARVIKAVTKEKYGDMAFKIRMEPRATMLVVKQEDNIINFSLKIIDSAESLLDI